MKTLLRHAVIGTMALFAVGCTTTNGRSVDSAQADAALQTLQDGAKLDLSLVRVLRMTADGTPVEVVSLMPTTLAASGEAQSLAGFTADKSKVLFVTRTSPTAGADVMELEWSEIKTGSDFVFPVVSGDGTRDVAFTVTSKVQRPAEDE
jgi:hypothetical protein